jgi:hypothetical protein
LLSWSCSSQMTTTTAAFHHDSRGTNLYSMNGFPPQESHTILTMEPLVLTSFPMTILPSRYLSTRVTDADLTTAMVVSTLLLLGLLLFGLIPITRLGRKQARPTKSIFPPLLFECRAGHASKSDSASYPLPVVFQHETEESPKSFAMHAFPLTLLLSWSFTHSAFFSRVDLLAPKAYHSSHYETYDGPSFELIEPLFDSTPLPAFPPKRSSKPDNCSLSLSPFLLSSSDCSSSPPLFSHFRLSKSKKEHYLSGETTNVESLCEDTTFLTNLIVSASKHFDASLLHFTVDPPLPSTIATQSTIDLAANPPPESTTTTVTTAANPSTTTSPIENSPTTSTDISAVRKLALLLSAFTAFDTTAIIVRPKHKLCLCSRRFPTPLRRQPVGLLLLPLLLSATMSGLQTPLSLAAQAAADAQAAAQAAAATQAAAAAQAAATTISTADFMKFLQAYKAPTKLATIDQPRAGGINAT